MQDASTKGTTNQGERAPTAKLAKDQVYEIRSLQGIEAGTSVAQRYGVQEMAVYRIWSRTRWRHLPEIPLQ